MMTGVRMPRADSREQSGAERSCEEESSSFSFGDLSFRGKSMSTMVISGRRVREISFPERNVHRHQPRKKGCRKREGHELDVFIFEGCFPKD